MSGQYVDRHRLDESSPLAWGRRLPRGALLRYAITPAGFVALLASEAGGLWLREAGMALKPRLALYLHIWECRLPDWRYTKIIGYGYTPKEAYTEWIRAGGHRRIEA